MRMRAAVLLLWVVGCGGGGGSSDVDAATGQVDAATSQVDAQAIDAGLSGCSLGDPCCSGEQCMDGYQCTGTLCSCVQSVHGTLYLRTDGRVLSYQNSAIPFFIEEGETGLPLEGVSEIFDGHFHSCALKSDGTVWCWGKSSMANSAGQLGDGTLSAPQSNFHATQVLREDGVGSAPLTGAVHINSGSSRGSIAATTCAILDDTSLWCWGEVGNGGGGNIFNDGTNGNRSLAAQILAGPGTPLLGVDQITVGRRHACVRRSGAVECWAANIGGPLGQGDELERIYPTAVTLPGPASDIGAGLDFTCAHVGTSLYCWGSSGTGAIGNGPPADNTDGCINHCVRSPAQVETADTVPLTDVIDLDVFYLAACARRSDNTLYCWGAGAGNYAAPLMVDAAPVTDVSILSSFGSNGALTDLRYLSQDGSIETSSVSVTPVCGDIPAP